MSENRNKRPKLEGQYKTWGKLYSDKEPTEEDLERFEDTEKPAKKEVTLRDIADFILKQPDERVVCMGDARWRTENHKGHGCLMVHYGLEELGIDEPFNCSNNEWYVPKGLKRRDPYENTYVGGYGLVGKVFAKIKDEHSHTGFADSRRTMVWDVAYGLSDLPGYTDVVTDVSYWPFETITYADLKDNMLKKYYDAEKDSHKPAHNPS